MLIYLIYLSIFLASSASLYFSTKFLNGEAAKSPPVTTYLLANTGIVLLAKLLTALPLVGFPLAIASILFVIKTVFDLSWPHAVIAFFVQLFVVGGIKSLLGFFLAGSIGVL